MDGLVIIQLIDVGKCYQTPGIRLHLLGPAYYSDVASATTGTDLAVKVSVTRTSLFVT